MRSYGPKKRTKQDMRVAAFTMLTMRASLEGVTREMLVRSYGLTEPEAQAMLMKEQARRKATGRA
jgi:hypothetical protein